MASTCEIGTQKQKSWRTGGAFSIIVRADCENDELFAALTVEENLNICGIVSSPASRRYIQHNYRNYKINFTKQTSSRRLLNCALQRVTWAVLGNNFSKQQESVIWRKSELTIYMTVLVAWCWIKLSEWYKCWALWSVRAVFYNFSSKFSRISLSDGRHYARL